MDTVLVTGCNGFLGRCITEHLTRLGFEVFGLDQQEKSFLLEGSHYFSGDIATEHVGANLFQWIPRCTAVVHAAASLSQQPQVLNVNVGGTWQLLTCALQAGCSRFVYLSSVPVIGIPQSDPITENHPVCPLTLYHASKYFGEQLMHLPGFESLSMVTLRISSPIGQGMPSSKIIPVFLRNAMSGQPITLAGKGARVQNYIDAQDVAKAVGLVLRKKVVHGLFLLGGHSLSNIALAQLILQLTGGQSAIEFSGDPDPEETMRWNISYEKARRMIGYNPDVSIEDSLLAVLANLDSKVDAV